MRGSLALENLTHHDKQSQLPNIGGKLHVFQRQVRKRAFQVFFKVPTTIRTVPGALGDVPESGHF